MTLSPEDILILSLSRFNPRVLKKTLLASSRMNWPYFLKESHAHGVSPLIYHNMSALGLLSLLPGNIQAKLRKDYYRTSALNLLFSRALKEILGKMSQKKIPIIPLKGCLFMHTLYPSIALRPMIDLDFLVKEKDFDRASRTLNELGYKEVFDPKRPQAAQEYYAMVFENKDKATVELHKGLYIRFSHTFDMDGLWARAKRTQLLGQRVLTMSLEDTILSLCLHLAQHDFGIRLISLVDLSEIISQGGNRIHWNIIVTRSESQGMRTPVYLALLLLTEWFGIKIPAHVLRRLKPSAIKYAYLKRLYDPESLRFLRLDLPKRLTQLLLVPALMDRPIDAIRSVASYLGLRLRDALTQKKLLSKKRVKNSISSVQESGSCFDRRMAQFCRALLLPGTLPMPYSCCRVPYMPYP